MTPRLVLVFAVACGLVAANLYYAQPMLALIARDFRISTTTAGLIVTLTQIGFALGLLLIVPLGDYLDQRRLILRVLMLTALSLVAAALAPGPGALLSAGVVVGFTSVIAQMLVPFAATLADDDSRGRVVGTVMSGLLLGILLSRTFAGLVSQVAGWRAVFGVGAGLMVLLMLLLWHELPHLPGRQRRLTRATYAGMLRSIWALMRQEPVLRRRAFYGALTFATFNVLWTSVAFLLSRPPYRFGEAAIGVFALVGVAGALSASFAGRFADRGWSLYSTGGFLLALLLSFVLIGLGAHHLLPLVAGVMLLDLGAQGTHITNQSEIYRLRGEARSRLTTAYMVCYFIGGAIGSATSAAVYERAGWGGVSALGAGYAAIGLATWLVELARRRGR